MTWYKFWKAGERAFDRLATVALTLIVLRSGGYVPVPMAVIFVLYIIGFVGDVLCGGIAGSYEQSKPLAAEDHQ